MGLAVLYKAMGAYADAEPLYLAACEIYKTALGKNHPDYATSLNNLAAFYSEIGNYQRAKSLYQESLEIIRKELGKEHPYYTSSLNNLAELYKTMGDYDSAKPLYLEALEIDKKILEENHPDYATDLNNLAGLCNEIGDYENAELLYQKALEILLANFGKKHPNYATALQNLANLYSEMGNFNSAKPLLLEAIEIQKTALGKTHPDYAQSLNNLAGLYLDMDDLPRAEPLFAETIELVKMQVEALLPSLTEAQREAFVQSIQVYFRNFYIFAIQYYEQKPEIAGTWFNLQLTTKAMLFRASQKMHNQIIQSGNQTLIDQYKAWKSQKIYLGKLLEMSLEEKTEQGISPEIERQLQEETDRLEKEISLQSEIFANTNRTRRYTWQDIQKQLQPGEAAVEIVRFTNFQKGQPDSVKYIALVVKPQSQYPEMVVLDNGHELETRSLTYYRNLIRAQREDTYSYAKYWQPIQAGLQGVRKVYFSADGVYNSINLLTLFNPNTRQFLADELDIQMLTNTKDLVKPKTAPKRLDRGVLIGFPDYNNAPTDSLPTRDERSIDLLANQTVRLDTTQRFFNGNSISPLPGTKTEVGNIAQVFTQAQIDHAAYLEDDATESLVKSLRYPDVLHISTHGFFMADVPKDTIQKRLLGMDSKVLAQNPLLRSGLLLTGAKQALETGSEGILTAYEAMNLHLDYTRLVVLSACETGLGEIRNGEGVYGLQRAFQTAGAQTVLMSLWKVSDEATQEMMSLFYDYWLTQKQEIHQAFRNAQQQLRQKHPEPYFWGAFVMVGE
jgi:CHAT domain-containing protein/Flp pilus assembly protein TadD